MDFNKVLVETVVCTGADGKGARFKRMLEARQEFKRRQDGCIAAWIGQSIDGQELFIVQSVFADKKSWKNISQAIADILDTKDGGLESVFGGPPLVGMFEVPIESLKIPDSAQP